MRLVFVQADEKQDCGGELKSVDYSKRVLLITKVDEYGHPLRPEPVHFVLLAPHAAEKSHAIEADLSLVTTAAGAKTDCFSSRLFGCGNLSLSSRKRLALHAVNARPAPTCTSGKLHIYEIYPFGHWIRAGLDPSLGRGETASQKFLTTATSVTCALTSLTGMAATSREAAVTPDKSDAANGSGTTPNGRACSSASPSTCTYT